MTGKFKSTKIFSAQMSTTIRKMFSSDELKDAEKQYLSEEN